MRTTIECMPCFLRQALEATRMVSDDPALEEQVARVVLKIMSGMDLNITPPAMGRRIHQLIRELTETPDPYKEVKHRYNQLALQWLPDMRVKVDTAEDPLAAAIRLAIAGNIIDYGVGAQLSTQKVQETIEMALHQDLDEPILKRLKGDIQKAHSILYLGDNAGEIVFDRLLLERMPEEQIMYAVKASPIINDATMKDAVQAGLTDIVNVIDNGSNTPGTILDECSPAFRSVFESADLILAKGQGNFETLNETEANIYFLFQAKCEVVARHVNKPVGSFMLCRSDCSDCVEAEM